MRAREMVKWVLQRSYGFEDLAIARALVASLYPQTANFVQYLSGFTGSVISSVVHTCLYHLQSEILRRGRHQNP